MRPPGSTTCVLKRKVYLAKMNNLPKHHGAEPNAAASA